MKKIKIKLIFAIIFLLLTGCSYDELNYLAIASAMGIDYQNGIYTVSAQILDINKKNEQDINTDALIYEASGSSISEAIRNIGLKYPNTLYLGHLELLVIGKGEIEHGIDNSFDYFIRTTETRSNTTLVISTVNTASEILNPNFEKREQFPVKDMLTTIKNSMNRNGKTVLISIEEFISDYLQDGKDQVVASITMNNNPNISYKDTTLTNIATFKKNKFIGYLSDNSAMAYNILNNNFYDVNINTKYKDKLLDIAIFNPNSKKSLEIKNNKITVNLDIKIEGHILDIEEKIDLFDKKSLSELEEIGNINIKNNVEELLNFCKQNNIDILGLKEIIYKKYNKEYEKYKDKNIYEIADININSNLKIFRYGNIYKNIKGEKNGT